MKPEEIQNQRILFSALNWGMGHVSRSIPLIHQLNNQDNILFIACSPAQQKIFEAYFDNLNFIHHEDYPFQFNGRGNFSFDLLLSLPQLSKRLFQEKKEVENLIHKYKIDVCISDHRYGFYSNNITSIFITHQVQIALPKQLNWLNYPHHRLMKKFHFIWVLDDKKSKIAGKLSLNNDFKELHYIGIQSRFSLYPLLDKEDYTVVIVSGPSPCKEQFFKEELKKAKKRETKTHFISPNIKYYEKGIPNQVIINNNLNWRESDEIILKAKKVISRSGYSTIMDIHFLKCESVLSPTKGQYEQEYLAKIH